MPTRREALIGAGALLTTGAARAVSPFAPIEATLAGGRLGVAILDTATAKRLFHRADELFPFCSTFKLPLAAAVFAESMAGRLSYDAAIAFSRADIVPHAPVVEAALSAGRLSVRDLIRAVMVHSDNAAANLLMPLVGGAAGLTRFMRAHGGAPSRIDHLEPALNTDARANAADTTTPAAMLEMTRRLLLTDAIAPDARARLFGQMRENQAGLSRLRAGVSGDWLSGDRTGTADGQTNDIAMVVPRFTGRPVLIAAYTDAPQVDAAVREMALRAVGQVATHFVSAAFDKRRGRP